MTDPVQLSLGFTNRPHLVSIDEATLYDVPTRMVQLATLIKNDKTFKVMDAVIILRNRDKDGKYDITLQHYGFGNRTRALEMVMDAQLRLLKR